MKYCYLDRDGIINKHYPYVGSWDRFIFHDQIFTVMSFFKKQGYELVIVTNQSGIGRGYYSMQSFLNLSFKMIDVFEQKGLSVEVRFCPHKPEDKCFCRKPNIGLFINDDRSDLDIIIGDQLSDIEAGLNANIRNRWLINEKIVTSKSSRNASSHNELLSNLKKWYFNDISQDIIH